MTQRTATCACRALSITAQGEPVKVSACHCRSCQRRTGSAFSVAVFFPKDQATQVGPSHSYVRQGDSGQSVEFHFCPTCGSTVFWYPAFRSQWVGIAIGCFEDDGLRPTQAVYEQDRRPWVAIDIPPP